MNDTQQPQELQAYETPEVLELDVAAMTAAAAAAVDDGALGFS